MQTQFLSQWLTSLVGRLFTPTGAMPLSTPLVPTATNPTPLASPTTGTSYPGVPGSYVAGHVPTAPGAGAYGAAQGGYGSMASGGINPQTSGGYYSASPLSAPQPFVGETARQAGVYPGAPQTSPQVSPGAFTGTTGAYSRTGLSAGQYTTPPPATGPQRSPGFGSAPPTSTTGVDARGNPAPTVIPNSEVEGAGMTPDQMRALGYTYDPTTSTWRLPDSAPRFSAGMSGGVLKGQTALSFRAQAALDRWNRSKKQTKPKNDEQDKGSTKTAITDVTSTFGTG